MHPTTQKVVDAAHNLGLNIEIEEFESGTRTAEEAARAVGCGVAQIVKSLLFIVGTQPTMILVSGMNRLDGRKLANLCGVGRKQVKRSNADMARDVTGFAIGGVFPFGHACLLPTFIDADLQQFDTIWAAAGTPQAVLAITPQELVNATHGRVADL